MRKQDFLRALGKRLSGLPRQDVEERLIFYSEMIDDRIEDGLSESEAVLEIGSIDKVAAQILKDADASKPEREEIAPKRGARVWEILLLALGSPIWLSLAIAAFAVILSLYVVVWSLVVSVWAIFVSLVAVAVGGTIGGIFFALGGNSLTGIAVVGASIFSTGLAILVFFGCRVATMGTLLLPKQIFTGIKRGFAKKGES